jgi:hypothetical protein
MFIYIFTYIFIYLRNYEIGRMSKTELVNQQLGEKTVLTKAQSKSGSLRTTVPKGIMVHLKLTESDSLDWSLEIVNNRLVAVVTKDLETSKKHSGGSAGGTKTSNSSKE